MKTLCNILFAFLIVVIISALTATMFCTALEHQHITTISINEQT